VKESKRRRAFPVSRYEAASPALIEKGPHGRHRRDTGQYRIVDLRAGTYTVTFTLTGFNTYKREGIELTGSFTASVNADLRVGALENRSPSPARVPLSTRKASGVRRS